MDQNFTHLEWDTDFFGFSVARIMRTAPDEAELSKTLKMLHDNNYRLVYWYIPAGQHESSRIAQAHSGFLADEKVTYVKELAGISNSPGTSAYTSTSYPGAVADTTLINLALQSSQYSRFRLDPSFPQELCDKLYTCWITRSVNKEIAWEVLVVKEHNDLLGLITLGTKGDRGDIGLAAVAEHARGKGVGRILVRDADRYFAERGFALVQVVTQRHNVGACRLYESCGYQIDKIENIFHFWL
jgi:dTDP-4-amino-4,6-dideoxy-D-galactose acyltransferase